MGIGRIIEVGIRLHFSALSFSALSDNLLLLVLSSTLNGNSMVTSYSHWLTILRDHQLYPKLLLTVRQMDIHSYFDSTSADRSSSGSQNDTESEGENSDLEPSQPKKCSITATPAKKRAKYRSKSSSRKYCKKWEKDFSWLEYDEDCEDAFCKFCILSGKRRVVFGLQRHFPIGRKNESP